ncbi:MAG: TonB-dependent receptor, partial [Gemmatimonadales bacterium]
MTPIQVSWLIETQLHAAPPCLGRGSRDFRLLGPRAWSRPWTVVVFWVLAACLLPRVASSQQPLPVSIQGRVWAEDGTPVRAVLIRAFPAGSQTASGGAESDELGYFHVAPLPSGPYRLEVGRLGFEDQTREVELSPGQRANEDFVLVSVVLEVEGISVEAQRSRERYRFEEEAGVTVRELAGGEIKSIPGLAEADPLRAIEVLPGVVSTSDFSSAFNVRGGSADQNLILLDGIPVFNPTHLGGFFSVFNGDMIERAELRSGGFPARFGGRVSSVLEIETDSGDGSFRGNAGVSVLATRLALGGGLSRGFRDMVGLRTARWRFSGRRSYFDQILKPVFDFPYHLTDLQGVFEGWTQGGNRLSITAYTGKDVLDLTRLDSEDFPLRIDWDWGNDLIGARFTHPRDDGGWWELRSGFSRFSSGLSFPDFDDTELRSDIQQSNLEGDLEVRPTPYLTVTSGGGLRRLSYDNLAVTGGTEFASGKGSGTELFGYVQGQWKSSFDWIVELGARVDRWEPSRGDGVLVVSPRVSVKRFLAATQWALKGSAGRYTQYLHSLRDEELPLGLDVWILAGDQAPHVVSDQLQLGFEGYPREGWFFSIEGYYRAFDGVVTTNLADNPNLDGDDYLQGTGSSYGADLFLQRTRAATNGWLTISYLRASRSFPDLLSGLDPAPEISYPPVFDRRVDVDLVLQRDLGRGMEAGLRWNFGTGLPFTQPLGSYRYFS